MENVLTCYFAIIIYHLKKGDNDAEMLQLAAVGVAMSNAKPKAKEAADIIIQVPKFSSDFVQVV